ncbi:MAG: CHAT domain-containing protein [Acidobacteria bacterium]|nr:CHAT domain-containing protein [Acidobacteriota bacterium]
MSTRIAIFVLVVLPLAPGWGVAGTGAPPGKLPGVRVEHVAPGGLAEKAGLREGDLLLAWAGAGPPGPGGTPGAPAGGVVRYPASLEAVESGLLSNFPVRLTGVREGRDRSFTLGWGDWKMTTGPVLPPEIAPEYEPCLSAFRSDTPAAGAEAWEKLAGRLKDRGDPVGACLVYLRAGDAWQDDRVRNPSSALRCFRTARDLAQASGLGEFLPYLWLRMAAALRASRDLSAAADAAREGIALLEKEEAGSPLLAGALAFQGDLLHPLGRGLEAVQCFERSLSILTPRGLDCHALWLAHCGLGFLAFWKGDYRKAETEYLEALACAERIYPDHVRLAFTLSRLGIVANRSGKPREAAAYLNKALEVGERTGPDTLEMAIVFLDRGVFKREGGDLDEAERCYRRALTLFDKEGAETQERAMALNSLANLARQRGRAAEAREHMTAALAIFHKLVPDSLNEAMVLINLAAVEQNAGNLTAAEEYIRKGLDICERRAPGSINVVYARTNLGSVLMSLGDLAAAQAHFSAALGLLEKLAPGNPQAAGILLNLANVESARGNLVDAERYYTRALELFRARSPRSVDTALCLKNLGILVKRRYDFARARELCLQALGILEEIDPGGVEVARVQCVLANMARSEKNFVSCRVAFRSALTIFHAVAPGGTDEASAWFNFGAVELAAGNAREARGMVEKAEGMFRAIAPVSVERATCLITLGHILRVTGESDRAEQTLKESLAILARFLSGTQEEAETLLELGRLHRDRGELEQALDCFRRAVSAVENARGRLGGGRETQELYSGYEAEFYHDLVDVQIRLNRKGEAFHTLERARAHVLLKMLAERDIDFSREVPAETLGVHRRLAAEQERVREELAGLDPEREADRVEALRKRLDDLQMRKLEAEEAIRSASPRLASLRYPRPLTLPEVEAALEPGTLLLSYSTGEKNTWLFALLGRDLRVYPVPAGDENLRRRVEMFRRLVTSRVDPARLKRLSTELFKLLVGPASRPLHASQRLLICPDGPLHALPFAALTTPGGRFLVEERPLSTALSCTVYDELKRTGPRSAHVSVTAFGDPDCGGGDESSPRARLAFREMPGEGLGALPASRDEVTAIGGLYPGSARVFTGDAATEENALSASPGSRYVHFACHGVVDPGFPLNSCLVLSPPAPGATAASDGLLHAWEIFEGLKLDADLVVLSACRTALGQERGGEGLVGLTRAFFHAGAPAVVSSLWGVSDDSTALLMKRFYTGLKEGLRKDEALRRAQVALLRGKETQPGRESAAHPFSWAAFVLNGDPR